MWKTAIKQAQLLKCALLILVVSAAMAMYLVSDIGKRKSQLSFKARVSPVLIRPRFRQCLDFPEEDLRKIQSQVHPLEQGMTASLYLHALRVFGLDTEYKRGKLTHSRDTLNLLADENFSKNVLGNSLLMQTPHGVRCRTRDDAHKQQESHRDFLLAVLSEQRTPLSFTMIVEGKSFTLDDFLSDSIANFHLHQEEIEWTALSYAMWLPPRTRWTNKFGETFSFDDLAAELMRRPLDKSVCAGSHIIQAMITLVRVDEEECQILTPNVRNRIRKQLAAIVEEVKLNQAADGSWGPSWHAGLSGIQTAEPMTGTWSIDNSSIRSRLVPTSHIPEWLMLLPDGLRVEDELINRAGRWLHTFLKAADAEFVRNNFCPCTHGAIVLQNIRRKT